MTSPEPRRRFTFRDYLDLEEASNVKHEFLGGEIYAMAGGTPEHAALAMAVGAALFDQLEGSGCRVYSSDGDEWTQVVAETGELDLVSIGCRLDIEALYGRAGL